MVWNSLISLFRIVHCHCIRGRRSICSQSLVEFSSAIRPRVVNVSLQSSMDCMTRGQRSLSCPVSRRFDTSPILSLRIAKTSLSTRTSLPRRRKLASTVVVPLMKLETLKQSSIRSLTDLTIDMGSIAWCRFCPMSFVTFVSGTVQEPLEKEKKRINYKIKFAGGQGYGYCWRTSMPRNIFASHSSPTHIPLSSSAINLNLEVVC